MGSEQCASSEKRLFSRTATVAEQHKLDEAGNKSGCAIISYEMALKEGLYYGFSSSRLDATMRSLGQGETGIPRVRNQKLCDWPAAVPERGANVVIGNKPLRGSGGVGTWNPSRSFHLFCFRPWTRHLLRIHRGQVQLRIAGSPSEMTMPCLPWYLEGSAGLQPD